VTKTNKKLHKLRYWREVVGLKQDDISVLLGLKSTTYCQKENGTSEIRLSELIKIRDAFNKILEKNGNELITIDSLVG